MNKHSRDVFNVKGREIDTKLHRTVLCGDNTNRMLECMMFL